MDLLAVSTRVRAVGVAWFHELLDPERVTL